MGSLSSWGQSWGGSWGNAWGNIGDEPEPEVAEGGGGFSIQPYTPFLLPIKKQQPWHTQTKNVVLLAIAGGALNV